MPGSPRTSSRQARSGFIPETKAAVHRVMLVDADAMRRARAGGASAQPESISTKAHRSHGSRPAPFADRRTNHRDFMPRLLAVSALAPSALAFALLAVSPYGRPSTKTIHATVNGSALLSRCLEPFPRAHSDGV